ncbi:heme exporter protein CcmB, partial [Klebsiella pneumoniae]
DALPISVGGYLAMLAAFLTASATLCPFATAAALRLTVR